MIKHLEHAIAAFAQMTVICTFGLAVSIGAAGLSNSKLTFACHACAPPAAASTEAV